MDSTVISIDRSYPFNPEEYLCKGVKIDSEDQRSLALTEIDLSNVQFVSMLKDGELSINGEEKLSRLKASGNILLDAKIFEFLLEHKIRIPPHLEEKVQNQTYYISFDGTGLSYPPYGERCVLCLVFSQGEGPGYYAWFDDDWDARCLSAVLVSPESREF